MPHRSRERIRGTPSGSACLTSGRSICFQKSASMDESLEGYSLSLSAVSTPGRAVPPEGIQRGTQVIYPGAASPPLAPSLACPEHNHWP